MFSASLCRFWWFGRIGGPSWLTLALALPLSLGGGLNAFGESVPANRKHIIGPTATIAEVSTGVAFPARIDTGAKTCSLHVEKMRIKDEVPGRITNVGKTIRFLVKNREGDSGWIETKIAGAVKVSSSAQTNGEFDHRYKVRLTLQWKDFRKEVLVTLNDRTKMAYPLLIGRNFLRDDFLVDVAKQDSD